jgi:hypothetical protein
MVGSPLPLAEYESPFDVLEMFLEIERAQSCGLSRSFKEGDILNMIFKNPVRIATMLVIDKSRRAPFLYSNWLVAHRPGEDLMLVTLSRRFNSFRR